MELTNDYGGGAARTPITTKRCTNCGKTRPADEIAMGTCKGGCK